MSFCFSFFRKLFLPVFLITANCLICITADAALIDEIAKDFKPLSGYVVMSNEKEYIIDLDDTNGVVIGDLFSVVTPGEKIVHPVTQKVLGTLEEVKGILKVIRIKSGYSFARPLGKSSDIKRGDQIRRYENMPALFWDYTGKGKSFFAQLQLTLTALKWQDYESTQRSRPPQPAPPVKNYDTLIFILNDQGLEVRDPEFYVIRTYNPPESLSQISPRPSVSQTREALAKPAPAPLIAQPAPTEASKAKMYSKITKETARFKPEFERAQTIGKISSFSVMTDFIKYKNQLLMASTNGNRIEIYNVTDKLIPFTRGVPSYPGQILALKWWLPSENDPLYLTLVSWADNSVSASIFILNGKNLTPFIERIPRILGTFDLDADKRPETLLSQAFDGEYFFGGNVRELKLVKGEIKSFKPAIPLPRRFTVLGSLFADLTGDGQLETVFIRKSILYIYNRKNLLHRSPKHMGGSLSFLTYVVDPTAKNIMPTSASFEVSPIATDLDGDGLPEILTVASERNIIGDVAAAPGIKKSWLEILKFRNERFVKGTLGEEWDTPLQGLTVDNTRVLLVTTEAGDIFGKGRKSHLLAYSLDF
jgi:hypothetical protein